MEEFLIDDVDNGGDQVLDKLGTKSQSLQITCQKCWLEDVHDDACNWGLQEGLTVIEIEKLVQVLYPGLEAGVE